MKKRQRSLRFVLSAVGPFVMAGLLLAPRPAAALTSYWILQDANGTWNNDANWDNGVPKNPGDIAIITNNVPLTAARNITIDTAVSLKALKFAMPSSANILTVSLGGGGSLTMNSGDGSHSVIQQMRGSSRCKITASTILSNDLDVINSVSSSVYFELANNISGLFNIHVNPEGSQGTPYVTTASTFFGDTTIYGGKLMPTVDCFGSGTNGIRVVTVNNGAAVRFNSSFTIDTNRVFVAGLGGAQFDLNGKTITLNVVRQISGTNMFSIMNSAGTGGTLSLGGNNDTFTGSVSLNNGVSLRLNAGGMLDRSPVLNLLNAASVIDVQAKAGGYSVPSNQVVAGIGLISGVVSVANSGASIHPGSYSLPGPTSSPGILTVVCGGLTLSNGGTYAWELKQLKDNAYAPGTTTYSQLNVTAGSVNLGGGTLEINFNGIATPASNDAFWKTGHVWTILTAASPPVGALTVVDGTYTDWAFTTRVTGNTLELVYGPYTPPPEGTLMTVL